LPSLGENILNLSHMRQARERAVVDSVESARLKDLAPSGSNPGELRALTYVPPGLPPGAPLVVVLHGCAQSAAAYDYGSGWSTLAERHGFALLFPEQQRANNGSVCFNWFNREDVTAGHGEVLSIGQLTEQMIALHGIDRRRVFITGLSAGGAMVAAMLATSPELYAGGGIIAGLPFGAASGMMEALSAMHQPRSQPAAKWGDLVRAASPHEGPWPSVQIWHGTADDTVSFGNSDQLVAQWRDVLELPERPDLDETRDGAGHQAWLRAGHPVLERWTMPGMGHGTPIAVGGDDADRAVGSAGPYMLPGDIASTWHLARSWGLLTQASRPASAKPTAARPPIAPVLTAVPGPAALFETAMKAVGLLK
jgi:poly(hydroxyalkanoate) depolymerase family esterase